MKQNAESHDKNDDEANKLQVSISNYKIKIGFFMHFCTQL